MRPRLYARDPILRELVPRLVGLAYDRRELVPQEHRGDLPVTLLTGRRGMGHTAIMDALQAGYGGRVPVARVDVEQLGQERWPDPAPSNTSEVVEAVEELVCQLAPPVPGVPRPRFARLLPGMLAVSAWHRGTPGERQLASDRTNRLVVACGLWKESAGDWTAEVSDRLAAPDAQEHDLAPVADEIVRLHFERHTRSRERRAVTEWYHGRLPGGDDDPSALIRLSQYFHRGGDFRHAAERVLVAAFLTDLAGAYGRWQRANREPRPLALLDNVHTMAGARLLDLLLEQRATPDGARDPLVAVATWRGDDAAPFPDATRRTMAEVAVVSGWRRSVPGSSSAGLLTVPLPPLSLDDVLSMLGPAEGPIHHHLPSALHALTRGHPLGSSLLCEAVVRASAQRVVEPRELLDLPGEDGRPVGGVLLERLVPQPQLRAPLMLAALARDQDAAQALAAARPAVSASLPALARFLEEERWTQAAARRGGAGSPDPAGAGRFVGDAFLRGLLEHEARRAAAVAGPGQRWRELHGLLRDHHRDRGAGHEPDVLRHTLAAGDAAAVVAHLAESFAQEDAGRWLQTLRYAATAPCPPTADWTDRRLATAHGEYDHQHADADDTRRSVNRLLHVLWWLSESFAEPAAELCHGIAAELDFLSMRHPSGHAVLNEAARTWPGAARERRPYPSPDPR